MTFVQYIDNPMGKANAIFAARDSYKAEYMEKFDALYMREAGKIDRYLYYDKSRDEYYAHIKIPSESVKNFYYDVVIKFYTNDNAQRTNSSLKEYDIQFFSNDPAFIFTYMYVFLKHNMLIEELKNKCPKASLTIRPEQRNAYEVPGYVKSIYFAYILMSRSDMFLKTTYHNFGNRYSKTVLASKIASGEAKMEERRKVEAKEKALKKQEKWDKDRIANRGRVKSPTKNINTIQKIGKSPPISKAGNVSKVKSVKHIKPK